MYFPSHSQQDRRWNADKPSAALDPYIPTWLTTLPANHWPANFWKSFFFFFFGRKLWKVVQSQVELMKINFKIWSSLSLYIYIYIYISSSCIIFSRSVLQYIVIHRVGDNGRTVNTSTSRHISDQLGTENVCLTLLCWFNVMIWVLVCKNMYRYERYLTHFESFYHNPISRDGLGCR